MRACGGELGTVDQVAAVTGQPHAVPRSSKSDERGLAYCPAKRPMRMTGHWAPCTSARLICSMILSAVGDALRGAIREALGAIAALQHEAPPQGRFGELLAQGHDLPTGHQRRQFGQLRQRLLQGLGVGISGCWRAGKFFQEEGLQERPVSPAAGFFSSAGMKPKLNTRPPEGTEGACPRRGRRRGRCPFLAVNQRVARENAKGFCPADRAGRLNRLLENAGLRVRERTSPAWLGEARSTACKGARHRCLSNLPAGGRRSCSNRGVPKPESNRVTTSPGRTDAF